MGNSHPPRRPSLCFHPSTLKCGETLKAGLPRKRKEPGKRESRGVWKERERERERVYVLLAESDEEKSKKWSAINGKRNRQRMENNWRKMEARISKENASRWKKGGSSREGDSCLDSLLVFRLLLYLGVTKREAGPLRRSWWREGRGRSVCEPARERERKRETSWNLSTLFFLSRYLHPLLKWLFELFRSFCFFTAIVARSIQSREFD